MRRYILRSQPRVNAVLKSRKVGPFRNAMGNYCTALDCHDRNLGDMGSLTELAMQRLQLVPKASEFSLRATGLVP